MHKNTTGHVISYYFVSSYVQRIVLPQNVIVTCVHKLHDVYTVPNCSEVIVPKYLPEDRDFKMGSAQSAFTEQELDDYQVRYLRHRFI